MLLRLPIQVATIDRPMKQNQEWNIEGMNGNTPIRDPTSPLSGLILSSLLCIFVEEGLRQESHSLAITEDPRGSDRRHVEKLVSGVFGVRLHPNKDPT